MIVIADTGPINYLILIGEIEILPVLFKQIVVPAAVCEELKHPRTANTVKSWIIQPPSWLETRTPSKVPGTDLVHLGLGERDAILLAEELRAEQIIIDDALGRREAKRRRIVHTGTLGVLAAGAEKGLLDFRSAVDRLRQTNFYISQDLLDRLLEDQK